MEDFQAALNMARFGDPQKAMEAYDAGAAAAGGDEFPLDRDIIYTLPDGRTIRVLAAERTEDPETLSAIHAVYLAAEAMLDGG